MYSVHQRLHIVNECPLTKFPAGFMRFTRQMKIPALGCASSAYARRRRGLL